MKSVLLVGIGGFIGSASRYLVSSWVQRVVSDPWLPYGTLVVNVVGCLLIGLLSGLAETRQVLSPETRLIILVGVLGGFTTFSTFAFETLSLARDNQFPAALGNVGVHVIIGLVAVWIGHSVARMV